MSCILSVTGRVDEVMAIPKNNPKKLIFSVESNGRKGSPSEWTTLTMQGPSVSKWVAKSLTPNCLIHAVAKKITTTQKDENGNEFQTTSFVIIRGIDGLSILAPAPYGAKALRQAPPCLLSVTGRLDEIIETPTEITLSIQSKGRYGHDKTLNKPITEWTTISVKGNSIDYVKGIFEVNDLIFVTARKETKEDTDENGNAIQVMSFTALSGIDALTRIQRPWKEKASHFNQKLDIPDFFSLSNLSKFKSEAK